MSEWKDPTALSVLKDNDVHVWMFHLNTTPPGIKRFYPVLSPEEKERSENFIHFMHRKRFIASHGFMRMALSCYTDLTPEELSFGKYENGKPFIKTNNDISPIHFNLSHSNHFAMLAVSKNLEVGIDVEYMDRKSEWQKIIRRFFTEPEQKAIFSLPEDQQRQAFFQVWTRKEAHMKVTGQGLHLMPTRFTVTIPPQRAALLAEDGQTESYIDQWSMYDIELPESARAYCATLSTRGKAENIEQFIFS